MTNRPLIFLLPIAVLAALSLAVALWASDDARAAGIVTEDLSGPLTAADLANDLLGGGVSVSNVTYAGADVAAGRVSGAGVIGFNSGIVLSSGDIAFVSGPNVEDAITGVNTTSGDPDLDGLAGFDTFDAAVLEFDFVPAATSVSLQYVFASDGYNEDVNGPLNDVFAFYVNGTNCALVTGTSDPVSIDTINNGNPFDTDPRANPTLYRNNDLDDGGGALDTEMDGLTQVLTCNAAVNQGVTNHMKLAIADTGDETIDSVVFLKAGSFVAVAPTPSPTPTPTPAPVNDADGDGVLNDDDNCPAWSNFAQGLPAWSLAGTDGDCDGFSADLEAHVGTGPAAHCPATITPNDEPTDAWPPDFNDSRITSLADVVLMGPSYNKLFGQVGYNQRFDLNASSSITLADVVLLGPFYNKNCNDLPASSEALIAAALDAGSITFEESLRYRAYALYDLPGLPAEFHSSVVNYHAATELFAEVLESEGTLSAQLLADLQPFMARPSDPISIFNNPPTAAAQSVTTAAAVEWYDESAAGGNVRVWVRGDVIGGTALLHDWSTTVTQVWDQFPGIFRYGLADTPTGVNGNPDSAIDIYFASMGAIDPRMAGCSAVPPPAECAYSNHGGAYTGYVAPYSGRTSASYIMVDRYITGVGLTAVIAHELMHTGQHAYDIWEPFWLKDATAQWGAERVLMKLGLPPSPDYNYLPKFFDGLNRKLTRDTGDDLNRYGSWLFFFFASMKQGDGVVTSIWQRAAAPGVQNENAVDQIFPFVDNFDDFTAQNWNQAPVDPLYKGPPPSSPLFPTGLKPDLHKTRNFTTTSEEVAGDTPVALSALYYRYTFASNIRKVTFLNDIGANPDTHIWAIMKIGGVWQPPDDWSTYQAQRFCRDLPDQDLQEVIIVLSNSHKTDTLPDGPKLRTRANTLGCRPGWEGTATTTWWWSTDLGAGTAISKFQGSWEAVNDRGPLEIIECEQSLDNPCLPFYPTGNISWSWNAQTLDPYPDGCSESVTGQLAAASLPWPFNQNEIFVLQPDGQGQYSYWGDGFFEIPPGTTHCHNSINGGLNPPSFFALDENASSGNPPGSDGGTCYYQDWKISLDATTIKGSCYEFNYSYHYLRHEWEFHYFGTP